MMEKKRKKYGKAGNRKLTDLEDDKIKMETKSKQELAEIKQNLWRRYRDKGNQKLEPTRSGKIPEGWKLKD